MAASGTARAVTRLVVANRALRRLIASYFVLIVVEYGSWITLLVIANARGGPTAAGLVAVAQLLPSIALGPPLTKALARFGLRRGLTLGYALQTVGLGAVAAAVAAGLPLVMIALPAIVYSVAVGATRPMHAAFLPSAVRLPQELAAANVASSWADGLGALAGPAFAGVLLASAGESAAMLAFAAVSVLAAPLVAGAGISSEPEDEPGEEEESVAGIIEALRVVAARPSTRTLVAFAGGAAAMEGAMDLLVVVLAVKILMLGPGAAGYFAAAFGAGRPRRRGGRGLGDGRTSRPSSRSPPRSAGASPLAALAGSPPRRSPSPCSSSSRMSRTVQAVSLDLVATRPVRRPRPRLRGDRERPRRFGLAIGVVVPGADCRRGRRGLFWASRRSRRPHRRPDGPAATPDRFRRPSRVEIEAATKPSVFAALPAAPLEALVHRASRT